MSEEEWKEARRWIISTGVDLDNRPISLNESLCDFASSLRDGVIICSIANIMRPGSLEFSSRKIQNVEKHEFLCTKNISLFLKACTEVFNLSTKEIFDPGDLFDATDFAKVINTLSILSHHTDAKDFKKWTPFSVVPNKKKNKDDDHRTYGSLAEEIEALEANTESSELDGDLYDEESFSDAAYESIIYNESECDITAETIPSKREHIINEILDTEDGYVKHVRTIVQSYIPALQLHITEEDSLAVFLNIDDICKLHVNFYGELSTRTPSEGEVRPSHKADISAFKRYKERFLIYAYYCTHLDGSQKRVDQLLKKPVFRNTVEDLNKKLERRISLKGQLSVCFQRILKYKLLLADLLKNTPEAHDQYHDVQDAVSAMEDVANYINEYKRDSESVSEMEQIQKTLKFTANVEGSLESLRSDFGRHVHDGEVTVQMEGSNKKEQKMAFLFEKTLLFCKPNGTENEVEQILSLNNLMVRNTQPSTRRKISAYNKQDDKVAHCFTLKTRNENDEDRVKGCRMFTKTEQLKRSWMSAIRKCIEIVALQDLEGKTNNHTFRLTTFPSDIHVTCSACGKLLLGLVSQGYRCINNECKVRAHAGCLQNCSACENPMVHVKRSSSDAFVKRKKRAPVRRRKTEELGVLTASLMIPESANNNYLSDDDITY